MEKSETIVVRITTSPDVMIRIKRLLSWLHFNSRWGHSGTVAMSLDGDGWDKVKIEGVSLEENADYVSKRMIHTKTMQIEYASSEDWPGK